MKLMNKGKNIKKKLKSYIVGRREIHIQNLLVRAKNEDEALIKAKLEPMDDTVSYLDMGYSRMAPIGEWTVEKIENQ